MHSTSCAFARRTRRSFIGATALALALAAPAGAEPLRLDDVIAIALRDNPAIANAGQRAAALHARPAQVSAYDDPTLSWEAWDIPESLRVDAGGEQHLPPVAEDSVPGQAHARRRGRRARGRRRAARTCTRRASTSQAAVTRAYSDLWLAHQSARASSTRDRALVERLARTPSRSTRVGEAAQSDALRAQVELTHMTIEAQHRGAGDRGGARRAQRAARAARPTSRSASPEDAGDAAARRQRSTTLIELALSAAPRAGRPARR